MVTVKTKSNPAKTVLIITVGFLLIYILTKWQPSFYIALLLGTLGGLSDYLAKKIDFVWMKLTKWLSLIIPNILLTLVFYLFLTPLAFMSKLFGERNQLNLKNNQSTLFKTSNKSFEPHNFEKTW